jgi:hypothetical protein
LKILSVLIFPLFVLGLAAALDFDACAPDLCKSGKQHIGCGNSGNWASSCPSDKKGITINEDMKSQILAAHNKWRNIAASGKAKSLPGLTASKMATMQWDDELAKLAELNVRRCIFEHDQCRNTAKYNHVGQNIGISGLSNKFQDPTPTAVDLVNTWYTQEVSQATPGLIKNCCYSP